MFILKVEKFNTYEIYVGQTVSKIYRQIKVSCDQLEIGVTKKEIGSQGNFRKKCDLLTDKNKLEIEIKDILFTIVRAKEIPMYYDYMEHKDQTNKRPYKSLKDQNNQSII